MSFYLVLFIASVVFFILAAICNLVGLAIASSFLGCIVFSIIIDHLAKDYLIAVKKVIDDKEIVEVQVDDKFFQDSVTITYKDSNDNPVVYSTTLPWYCDIEVEQSKKTYIKIDSKRNTFYVYTDASGESGDIYTSKK